MPDLTNLELKAFLKWVEGKAWRMGGLNEKGRQAMKQLEKMVDDAIEKE